MKKRQTVVAGQVPFQQVEWGLTKNLVGPESMGAEKLKVNITEYKAGFSH
jgi:hypothetical protein